MNMKLKLTWMKGGNVMENRDPEGKINIEFTKAFSFTELLDRVQNLEELFFSKGFERMVYYSAISSRSHIELHKEYDVMLKKYRELKEKACNLGN